MNRLRRRRYGDGWTDPVNPVRVTWFTVLALLHLATTVVLELVFAHLAMTGNVPGAVLVTLGAALNLWHTWANAQDVLEEVRRS
ncbi:hypothetical protein BO221_14045 [Archangium sp. Cb G35]|uniref:hypothetical protein n=1 Tax=Archangium sp. Cb G35 TaxID=1920190 RepID=UPI0009366B2D|nr:hypothetical protein [Archangium sp. Cb G35]OJT24293.1 hypothetical protein BO221_14045 [Archangium sp. Cb G35]